MTEEEMGCRHWRIHADNGNKTVEKTMWRKSRMERESQRRLKPTVGCSASKRRRRIYTC